MNKINIHRKETIFIPTFVTPKPYVDKKNNVSLRTYENIVKEKNFYLPLALEKQKKISIKELKNSIVL